MSDESGDDLDAVRRDLLAQRGIDPLTARLKGGETLDEIEASADALAKLIGSQGTREQADDPLASLLADPAAKQRRQRSLVASLHGPQPQARDEFGRYTIGPSSFDGGARVPVAAPVDAEADHGRLIVELVRAARVHRDF